MKFLIVPVTLIASLAIIIWLIVPTYNEAARIRDTDLVEARSKLKTEMEISKNIASFKEDFEAKRENLRVAKYALPEEEDVKSLLVQLETIFANNGVAYESIAFQQENQNLQAFMDPTMVAAASPVPAPKAVKVQAKVAGSYEGLAGFVNNLENLNRLCNITSVDFSIDDTKGEESGGDSNILKGDISFFAYKQEAMKPEVIRQAFQRGQQTQQAAPLSTVTDAASATD